MTAQGTANHSKASKKSTSMGILALQKGSGVIAIFGQITHSAEPCG